jgi:hypothetical protein
MVVLNNELSADIQHLRKTYKDKVILGVINAFETGDITAVYLPATHDILDAIPFIKYKQDGKDKIILNMTKHVHTAKTENSTLEYTLDNEKKLYALSVSAYLYLRLLSPGYSVSSETARISADIFSNMYTKVLNRIIGLNTIPERYEAFKYFSAKFFLLYYLELHEDLAESTAVRLLKNGKSFMIDEMTAKIEDMGLPLYTAFTHLCQTLFNNEVSNIRGVKADNVKDQINFVLYFKRFIEMFNSAAIGIFLSFPYFVYVVMAGTEWTGLVNNRAMEDTMSSKMDPHKLMVSLYKDLR